MYLIGRQSLRIEGRPGRPAEDDPTLGAVAVGLEGDGSAGHHDAALDPVPLVLVQHAVVPPGAAALRDLADLAPSAALQLLHDGAHLLGGPPSSDEERVRRVHHHQVLHAVQHRQPDVCSLFPYKRRGR